MTTIQDVIRLGGVGYRESKISEHRGSDGNGFIDVDYLLYAGILTKEDIIATDWVAKNPSKTVTAKDLFEAAAEICKERYNPRDSFANKEFESEFVINLVKRVCEKLNMI